MIFIHWKITYRIRQFVPDNLLTPPPRPPPQKENRHKTTIMTKKQQQQQQNPPKFPDFSRAVKAMLFILILC